MRRIYGYTHEQVRTPRLPNSKIMPLVSASIRGGMVTSIDPADLPNELLQLAKNAVVRFDKTSRRPGQSLFFYNAGHVANGYPKKLAAFKEEDGTAYTILFYQNKVYKIIAGVGTELVATPALTSTVTDRIRTAFVLEKLVFSNNSADPIQQVDPVANTVTPLGNAPAYRYVAGMFNRVVGAARSDSEIDVGWSGDANITEWNPAVDDSAGSSPIIDSPDDLSDHITGLFAMPNMGLLLREKSLWLFNKQPIETDPFFFYTAIPGLGCDIPNSAARVFGGIAFADRRTQNVYAYAPNSAPEPIGNPVKRVIINMIDDPETVFSGFSARTNEFKLCIPQAGSDIVVAWTYSFTEKAWTQKEYRKLTFIDDTTIDVAELSIDGLGDTPIDSLLGTIDDLTIDEPSTYKLLFGRQDGRIVYEDEGALLDVSTGVDDDGSYEMILVSKSVVIPEQTGTVVRFSIEYQCQAAGRLRLEYSRNNKAPWTIARQIDVEPDDEPLLLVHKSPIKVRRFTWRLIAESGKFDILGYAVYDVPTGSSP